MNKPRRKPEWSSRYIPEDRILDNLEISGLLTNQLAEREANIEINGEANPVI
jgi:hypothetical protein